MSVQTLEIKPNRLLMDSNFDGYKLSLEEQKMCRKPLEVPVDKTFLNSSQYGLLHAKLFGLHNHLFGDQFDNFSSVYFVDRQFNIRKTYVDNVSEELVDPVTVFSIPKAREQKTGDYNVTLRFASAEYAVVSDGMGTMYILATKDKKDDDEFENLFSGKVLSNEEQGFIISDALYKESSKEMHVLLLHIQEDQVDRFVTIIHWLTFRQVENSKAWGQVALRQLKTRGEVQYLHLERHCEHIYVVSETTLSFVLNSEHPIQIDDERAPQTTQKVYQWSQTLEDITVKVPLQENAEKDLVQVTCEPTKIDITYNAESLLSGDLEGHIDSSLLTWTLGNDKVLEIVLSKTEGGVFWKELITGDQQGEYILDTCIVDQANENLQKFTGDTEVIS